MNILSINSDYLRRLKTLYISRVTNISFLLTISIDIRRKHWRCWQSRFNLSEISWERGSDSADIFKLLWFADHPAIWMSQTSFILQDKPVLSVHAHVLWSLWVTFSVPTLKNKTNGCRFKFNAIILRKLSIQRIVNCGRVLVLFLEKLENAARFEMDFVLDLTGFLKG